MMGMMGTMGQIGFFDADRRLAAISAKGDPLEMITRVVPFESFRAEIEAAVLTPANEKKSNAGRKPIDVIVMFRNAALDHLGPTGRAAPVAGLCALDERVWTENRKTTGGGYANISEMEFGRDEVSTPDCAVSASTAGGFG